MRAKALFERILMFVMRLRTCREVERFAYDFLEGNLDPKMNRQVERHLKTCKNCGKFIVSYRKTRELGRVSPRPSLDPEFKERIFEFLVKKGVFSS
jgi:hypothetical protein